MISLENINLEELEKNEYNIITFDIETSSFIIDDKKYACMYVFALCVNEIVYFGRRWEQFIEFIEKLNKLKNNYIIWVHNLSYEFQFLYKKLKWDNLFFIENRTIAYAKRGNVTLRCTYLLSGYSLEKIAEHLNKYKIKKLKGELDYYRLRTPVTKLYKNELTYLKNDVLIVYYYILEKIEQGENQEKIPLTKTGYVRRELETNCLPRSRNKKKEYFSYKNKLKNNFLSVGLYEMLKSVLCGGYVHANPDYIGLIEKNVYSYDKTSAYPYNMVARKFPVTPWRKRMIKQGKEFDYMLKTYACIFTITFYNIRPIFTQDYYISTSKLIESELVIEVNGRLISANKITINICEIDYLIISKNYTWDSEDIYNFHYSCKNYLPLPFIKTILYYYNKKTLLKGDNDHIIEYRQAKENINSIYGMCVMQLDRTIINIEDNIYTQKMPDIKAVIDTYNKNRKRTYLYEWGVYITAYTRLDIWKGIFALGEDYRYTDTDSLKFVNNHQELFETFNIEMMEEIKEVADYYHISLEDFSPLGKTIGLWDFEGGCDKFKTLGAKRYMLLKDGKYELTCAGLNKKAIDYIVENGGFDFFSDDMTIPPEETGKLTHTYIDDAYTIKIKDYQGNISTISEDSYIHLEKAPFSLSLSENVRNYGLLIKEIMV